MALQVWLPLNGDLHNQGLSKITMTGTPTWKTSGKIGASALDLSSRISFTCPELNGIKYFSVCFWGMIEPNPDSTANWMDVFSLTDKSTSDTTGYFRFETGYGAAAQGGIHWHDNATNAIVNGAYTYNTATEQNKWHHICVTISSDKICSYYDGILKQTQTSNLGGGSLTGVGWIGESTTRGGIQDLRIYDHALSTKEVEEISKGLILHYKFNQEYVEPKTITPTNTTNFIDTNKKYRGYNLYQLNHTGNGETAVYTFNSNYITFKANTKYVCYTYFRICDSTPPNLLLRAEMRFTNSQGQYSNIGWSTGSLTLSKKIDDNWMLFYVSRNGSATSDIDCYIRLTLQCSGNAWQGKTVSVEYTSPILIEGKQSIPYPDCIYQITEESVVQQSSNGCYTNKTFNNFIVYDCSGYCNHGEIYGTIKTSQDSRLNTTNEATTYTPRYFKSIYLTNGQLDYIVTKNPVGNPKDAITMNIWFKSNNITPGSDYHHCFNGLTSWVYIEMAVHKNGYLRSGLYINGTRYVANTNNTNLLDGKWHMLTMTYDGSNVKRYVDAELKSTQAATGNIDRFNDKFIFGHGTSTGYYCKETYLSDARLYATALSAQQILELYNTSMSIDKNSNIYSRDLSEYYTANELISEDNIIDGGYWMTS